MSDIPTANFVPYLDIEAFINNNIRQYADPESSKLSTENDVLIVWDGARSGLTGSGKAGAIGSTIVALTPLQIEQKYLLGFLQTKYDYINGNHRGSGIPHVDPDIFWNIDIPIAPLNEQKRIVAKLEKLLVKVNESCDRLSRIPTILKRFRQSVLASACSGRLTADWRKSHPDIESADELLKRISDVQIDTIERFDAFDYPEDWEIVISKPLFSFVTSGSRGWAKYYADEGHLFIRVGNLNHDTIDVDFSSIQKVKLPEQVEGKRTKVEENDILILTILKMAEELKVLRIKPYA